MNRDDFRALAGIRVREARMLRDEQHWCGCYYLAGHAVECALKACIASATRRYDFPDKRFVQESYTHDLTALLKLAALDVQLRLDSLTRPAVALNWSVAKDWTVDSRYNRSVTARQALDLYRAVAQRGTGVLPWVRQYW